MIHFQIRCFTKKAGETIKSMISVEDYSIDLHSSAAQKNMN